MATRRWRPLALASIVLVTLAGAVVLRSSSDDGGEPAASPQPVASAPTASTVAPSPTPGPPLTAIEPVLIKQTFAAGVPVTAEHGVAFLDAASGALEAWSHLSAIPGGLGTVHTTPDGALLVSHSGIEGEPPAITERATGRTWRFAINVHPRLELAAGTRIAVGIRNGDLEQPAILDVATGAITPFGTALDYRRGSSGVPSPDGRRFALQLGSEVLLVDAVTAQTTRLAEGVAEDGYTHVRALPGALGFVVVPTEDAGPRRWFSWEGVEVARELPAGAVSPGGKYIAAGWSPGRIKGATMGATPAVGAVTIYDRAGGHPVSQFLGAEPLVFEDLAWSPTGDSLVVQVPEGYRLVTPTGAVMTTIPDSGHYLDPRPSPTIAGLLGTNAGTIINTVRGITIAPAYADKIWRARWSTKPGELVVELSSPGKGRDWPVDVMPFQARTAAIDPAPAVAVDPSEGCAPLRERPHGDAPQIDCLPRGRQGKVTEVDDPETASKPSAEPPRRYAGIEDASRTVWLHLEMADGATGWAQADQLTWAN